MPSPSEINKTYYPVKSQELFPEHIDHSVFDVALTSLLSPELITVLYERNVEYTLSDLLYEDIFSAIKCFDLSHDSILQITEGIVRERFPFSIRLMKNQIAPIAGEVEDEDDFAEDTTEPDEDSRGKTFEKVQITFNNEAEIVSFLQRQMTEVFMEKFAKKLEQDRKIVERENGKKAKKDEKQAAKESQKAPKKRGPKPSRNSFNPSSSINSIFHKI